MPTTPTSDSTITIGLDATVLMKTAVPPGGVLVPNYVIVRNAIFSFTCVFFLMLAHFILTRGRFCSVANDNLKAL